MKRIICSLLVFCLIGGLLIGVLPEEAAAAGGKDEGPRSIGIVFDNSGSMYVGKNSKAWCRATYAIEVFAAMLNDGDNLSVYPMEKITIDDSSYDMNNPVTITGPEQASLLRKIYTPEALDTPIEAIDAAYEGLKKQDGEKWLIVLTDGATFYENLEELKTNTPEKLNERLGKYSQDMNVLYLAIGEGAAMPTSSDTGSYRYIADKATSSEEVLSRLTGMCNMIFGRDSLPEENFSNQQITTDVSVSKMILFVQGENVSDVKLTDQNGNLAGTLKSSCDTRYSETGAGNYNGKTDTSLQGMIVTYTNCPAGSYTLSYSGTASSTEVYYEPDVDLVFTFTDSSGLPVNSDALFEGDYTVSFGLKDGKTGEYTNSQLLGNTSYNGEYFVNGDSFPIQCNEKSGSCTVPLKVNDTFNAQITAEYLSGYKITKDGQDFEWPESGLSVAPRPAGDLELKISGGDSLYHLPTLDSGARFTAQIFYEGELLTGEELETVEITWNPDDSGALLTKDFQDDHYDIVLSHKDTAHPENTPLGVFSFPMDARYTPSGSNEVVSMPVQFTYEIDDNPVSIQAEVEILQAYYQISKLDEGDPIRVELLSNGSPLTPQQMEQVQAAIDCGGLDYTLEPLPQESAFLIHLEADDHAKAGKYLISCAVGLADEIGRVSTAEDDGTIKLGGMALWLRWLIILLVITVIVIAVILILNHKAMPKHISALKRDGSMNFDGDDVSSNGKTDANRSGGRVQVQSNFGNKKFGLVMDGKAAEGSKIRMKSVKRSMEISSSSVKKIGSATIQEATIGTAHYVLNEETHKLERFPKSDKPLIIKHGTRITYSGTVMSNGESKPFSVTTKLNFKKKKK